MLIVSVHRSIKFALQSFWRNIWLSIVTIFMIFLALLSINFLVIIQAGSEAAITAVKERIDVSIYFKNNIRETTIAEIKAELEALSQVRAIEYRSPQQNLELFRDRHQNDPSIQETLKELEGNPLGATLIVRAKRLEDYPVILEATDNPKYAELIEEKSFDDHHLVIERITAITDNVRKAGLISSAIFVLIACLIVFNTVRIAIFTHQNEITVMKLVGASNWFIRAPFIIETILYGVVASVLAIAIIYPTLFFLQPRLTEFFGGTAFDLVGYVNHYAIFIFGGQLVGIVLLTMVSSSLAINKYLKV